MIYDLKMIRHNYILSGWFAVDFLSVIPFDVLLIKPFNSFMDNSTTEKFRVVRLVKLLRLARAWGFVKGSTADLKMDYNLLNLIVLMFALTVFSHWMVRRRSLPRPLAKTSVGCRASEGLGLCPGARRV